VSRPHPPRRRAAALGCALAGCALSAGCSGSGGGPHAAASAAASGGGGASVGPPGAVAIATLPPSPLAGLVPAPGQLAGFQLVADATGPRDAASLTAGAPDPPAARAALAQRGFQAAYAVEYTDALHTHVLTVVVTRFAAPDGAAADLAADLAAPQDPGATVVSEPQVGERSQVVDQPLPGGPAGSHLVTVRARTGRDTFLVAASSVTTVDAASARTLAAGLVARDR
jgi:hypothetical protein